MKNSYKPSEYNIVCKAKGQAVVANTFSCSVSELTEQELGFLNGCYKESDAKVNLSDLANAGLMVPCSMENEKDLLYKGIELSKTDRTHATVTVLTTLDCNFACPYCFQKRNSSVMGENTQKLVIEHINSVVSQLEPTLESGGTKAPPELGLCFTGGEPLLVLSAIRRIVQEVSAECKAQCVTLNTTMITNGYLLSPKVANVLKELSPKWVVQITLDGPKEIHDTRRALRTGGGTYDRIVDNINQLDHSAFTVKLRINVDKTNRHSAKEVYDWACGLENVYPGVALVTAEETQSEQTKSTCFSRLDEQFIYEEMNREGIVDSSLDELLQRGTICTAQHQLSCCIDPNGYLYKCFDKCGQLKLAYKKLGDSSFSNPEAESVFLNRNAVGEEECSECKLLPQCLGGCSLMWIERKKHSCVTAKYLIENALSALCDSAP